MDIVKESLLTATAFTLLMVLLGVMVGLQMDDLRQDRINDEVRQSNIETETFTVLQNYVEDSDKSFCELIELRLPEIGERNADLGAELERFANEDLNDEEEYAYLRNRYYNNQVQLLMLVNDYKERCGGQENTIMYFFDDSTQSQRQGSVLDEVGANNDNVYVFSFNKEIADDPTIEDSLILEVLLADYDITETPTLIVNGDEKIEGFISVGELENEVLQ